jgi:hypothetical protein
MNSPVYGLVSDPPAVPRDKGTAAGGTPYSEIIFLLLPCVTQIWVPHSSWFSRARVENVRIFFVTFAGAP